MMLFAVSSFSLCLAQDALPPDGSVPENAGILVRELGQVPNQREREAIQWPVTQAAFAEEFLPVVDEAPGVRLQLSHGLEGEPEKLGSAPNPVADLPVPKLGTPSRQGILLRAARNSVSLEQYGDAIERFETLLSEYPPTAEVQLEFAGVLVAAGQAGKAISRLRTFAPRHTEDPRFRNMLAEILVGQGKHREAQIVLGEIVQSGAATAKQTLLYARVLGWLGNEAESLAIVGEFLSIAGVFPVELQADAAQFYLDLGRPDEAAKLFVAALENAPGDTDALVGLVLADSQAGREAAVYESLDLLLSGSDAGTDALRVLAERLMQSGAMRQSLRVFHFLADLDPQDWKLQLRIAAAHRELYEFEAARVVLESLGEHRGERLSRLEAGILKTAVGEYAGANAIYRSLLGDDPNDARASKGLGDLYLAIGDFNAAETLLNRAQQNDPSDEETPALLMHALIEQQQIVRALALVDFRATGQESQIGGSKPPKAAVDAASTLLEARRWPEVESICSSALRSEDSPPRVARLRLYQGYAQMKMQQYAEALEALLQVAGVVNMDLARLQYARFRCLEMLGDVAAAEALLSENLQAFGNATSDRIAIAQLAIEDCDWSLAKRLLEPCQRFAPDSIFGHILMGETQAMCDRQQGSCGDVQHFQRALDLSPSNTRAQIGLARSFARQNLYAQSVEAYTTILRAFPHHEPARVEQARVIYAWKGVDSASHHYQMAEQRQDVDPAVPHTLVQPEDFSSLQVGIEQAGYRKAALSAERSGKYFKSWRPQTAGSFYGTLSQIDPSNQESYFDHAQILSTLGETRAAICKYDELLAIEPCHVESNIARNRLGVELRPRIVNSFDFQYTAGRDGLADISSLRLESLVVTPRGDVDEYVVAGYAHRVERPDQGQGTNGHVGIVGFQSKPFQQVRFNTLIEFETYTHGFGPRPTFRSGIDWLTPMDFNVGLAGYLENVVVNGESIRQDVFRGGFELTAGLNPSWRWRVDGLYRYASYSDHNSMHELLFNAEHMIIPGRRQLQAKFDFGMLAYDQSSVPGPGNNLLGTIHPYFSPSGFTYATAGLEHKFWTSRHNFHGACERWLSAYGGARIDIEAEPYAMMEFRSHHDLSSYVTTELRFNGAFSQVYENVGVAGLLTIRLP